MADESQNASPAPVALDVPGEVAAEQATPSVIPVSEIGKLEGFYADPARALPGESLTGDEQPKGKITVRTRYPVDRLDVGDLTITGAGVKVSGSDLSNLVKQARSAGVELEGV